MNTTRQSNYAALIEYMNDRYDDRFTFAEPFGGMPGDSSAQAILHSEKYPDKRVWVMYESDKDVYSDNYIDLKYEEETRAELQRLLTERFGCEVDLKYEAATSHVHGGFTQDTSFEDYFLEKREPFRFSVSIVSEATVWEEAATLETTVDIFRQAQVDVVATFFFFSDRETYETAIASGDKSGEHIHRLFLSCSDGAVRSYTWR